jgi:hypothetical protein
MCSYTSRSLSVELADFAVDNCRSCERSRGACIVSRRVAKCLYAGFIVGVFRGFIYTVRPDYSPTDYRHYIFGSALEPFDPFGMKGNES